MQSLCTAGDADSEDVEDSGEGVHQLEAGLVLLVIVGVLGAARPVLALVLGHVAPVLVCGARPVRHLTQAVRLGERLIRHILELGGDGVWAPARGVVLDERRLESCTHSAYYTLSCRSESSYFC